VRRDSEISDSQKEYVGKAIAHCLNYKERVVWSGLDHAKGTIINKARWLFFDVDDGRKTWEKSGGLPRFELPLDPEQELLRKEETQLCTQTLDRIEQYIASFSDADEQDEDALVLFRFCRVTDEATEPTDSGRISFKSKNVIERALSWDPDRVQQARIRIIERARELLAKLGDLK
jgi:hypothetical protein